jgi:hypothetical protein
MVRAMRMSFRTVFLVTLAFSSVGVTCAFFVKDISLKDKAGDHVELAAERSSSDEEIGAEN